MVTSKREENRATIYIDDIPHLILTIDMVVGFQSWMSYDYSKVDRFIIEIYITHGGPVLLEYNTIEKWKEILIELEALLS